MKQPMPLWVLVLFFAWIAPASAEINYPYCMHVYTRDQYVDCSYSTLAQCQAAGSGRPTMCYLDPFYKGNPGTPYHKHHRSKKKHT